MNAVNHDKNSPARRTAFGGILAALALLFLFLATVLPTNRIFFYGLSSVFISIIIIEFGITAGWIFYAVTAILALLFIPHKFRLIPYLLIVGHYGIWKTLIESINHIPAEILLKLAVLNLGTLAGYFLAKFLFLPTIILPFDIRLLLAGLQLLFLIYDYSFTVFVRFYFSKIRPYIKTS